MSVLTCSWQCIDIFINRWQKKKWLIVLWKNWWLTFRILPGRPALTATGIVGKVLAEWKNKNLVDFWNRFLTTVFGFKFAVALASFVFNFNTKWCRFWFLVSPLFGFIFFFFFWVCVQCKNQIVFPMVPMDLQGHSARETLQLLLFLIMGTQILVVWM